MGSKTKIAWCDATWNPFRGCSRVSPGCQNCYAERMCSRGLPGLKSPASGDDFAVMTSTGPHWTGQLELIESALEIQLHWKRPRRVFVNSMSDTFHERIPDGAIGRVFESMCCAPQHTFIVCTKRAKRMREFMAAYTKPGGPLSPGTVWCCRHIIFLASVEDQQRADERIPDLLATPAAVRGISLEPMLGPVDLRPYLGCLHQPKGGGGDIVCNVCGHVEANPAALQWVIVGSESGPGARPCNLDWVRDVRDQCAAAGVAFFFKQWVDGRKKIEMPFLDGRQWVEFPEVRNGA